MKQSRYLIIVLTLILLSGCRKAPATKCEDLRVGMALNEVLRIMGPTTLKNKKTSTDPGGIYSGLTSYYYYPQTWVPLPEPDIIVVDDKTATVVWITCCEKENRKALPGVEVPTNLDKWRIKK